MFWFIKCNGIKTRWIWQRTCSPGSQAVSELCQLREEMINVTHSTLQALIDPWLQVSQCSEGMPAHTCCDRIVLEASMQTREMNNCLGHRIAQATAVSHRTVIRIDPFILYSDCHTSQTYTHTHLVYLRVIQGSAPCNRSIHSMVHEEFEKHQTCLTLVSNLHTHSLSYPSFHSLTDTYRRPFRF